MEPARTPLSSFLLRVTFLKPVACFPCSLTPSGSRATGSVFPSVGPCFSLPPFLAPPVLSQILLNCVSLLLCTVGSFSEHLDQINGRSECVDSTDNSSKPSSEPASHMARQRLESTEKKKISGKVTKSLSASALSLMIPGGRETSACMKLL